MSESHEPRHTNRLAGETSPYLLQHAHNPVDWYPWGAEALETARTEDKPILLSIGYSACHWCHVMERESFEDPATAELMNRWFVPVKVDREERPDLDQVYMQAVQAMTGQGGWPMTVFLAPDGTPFWGGTYFPPQDRPGMPGFPRVLNAMAEAWRTRRGEILRSGRELKQHLEQSLAGVESDLPLDTSILDTAMQGLLNQFDARYGGFGAAPKFPQPMAIEFLLRQWRRTNEEQALRVAQQTLIAMAQGGMYDQLGGGFHRYSVDEHWLVPHFEKMLYDNAQLARAYLMAYQATGNAFFHDVVEQTLDYVLRDMTDPSGGFYSTEDADSEGHEGKFYVWQPSEVEALLGENDARLFCAYYDVTEHGNFEPGKSILHVRATPAQVTEQLDVPEEAMLAALERGREVLFAAREQRVRPARDEKVLAAWNGLMLRAFAEASRVLGRPDYRAAAVRNGEFLLSEMRAADGRLRRTWKPGHGAKLNGYLEDYANVADGLVALYEATFDLRWLSAAQELADAMLEHFSDPEGGFFDTSNDHETLVTRPKDLFDNATPAGNSVAVDVLLRLALLTDEARYREAAERLLSIMREPMAKYPLGFARLLSALDFMLGRPKEVAIIGSPGSDDTEALVDTVFEQFLPNKVVAGRALDDAAAEEAIPLLQQRDTLNGAATAYVCEHYTCLAPVTAPEALRAQLKQRD